MTLDLSLPWQVIHGDCLDVMRSLPDGCVDAVVTDPPYNVGFKYDGDSSGDKKSDYAEWCARWFAELLRLSRGPILVTPGLANVGLWTAMRQPDWMLSWWKPASMGRCAVGFNNWEPVLLYGKSKGKQGADVIRAPLIVTEDMGGHPCPKPVEWAQGQMERCVADGSLVLDPFAGSGSTGVASIRRGNRFIGIEREAAYVDIARRRIADAAAQGNLFGSAA